MASSLITADLPVDIKSKYGAYLSRTITDIPLEDYQELRMRIDACVGGDRNIIREIAAIVPNSHWQQHHIALMLRDRSPAEALLHNLGNLNKTLHDVIIYMQRVDFWSGLEIFCKSFMPVIKLNIPVSKPLRGDQSLSLKCMAAGVPAPKYQWFSGRQKLEGQTLPELNLPSGSITNGGGYVCSIRNSAGNVYTCVCKVTVATVQPVIIAPSPSVNSMDSMSGMMTDLKLHEMASTSGSAFRRQNKARDKVALLIGNSNHLSNAILKAPLNDVRYVGQRLEKMGFKTLICKDLNKADMHNIINFFIGLLKEGVYGILYFAGHGFESPQRECFLVPSDAPPVTSDPYNCVSAREIHSEMLEKKPSLCLIILDICRVKVCQSSLLPQTSANSAAFGEAMRTPRNNNTSMVVYATNEGAKAWEVKEDGEHMSVFCNHLLLHIDERVPLVTMMTRVLASMSEDRIARKNNQSPELQFTLAPDLSLWDEIDHSGYTRVFQESLQQWEQVRRRPKLVETQVPELGITVRRVFDSVFSNSLIIYLACMKTDRLKASSAHAYISRIHNQGAPGQAELLEDCRQWPKDFGFGHDTRNCLSVTKNTIDGLEKLDSDLKVAIKIDGSTRDAVKYHTVVDNINLGRPLLAQLKYGNYQMKGQTVLLTKKQPEEHEESTAVQNDEFEFSTWNSEAAGLSIYN